MSEAYYKGHYNNGKIIPNCNQYSLKQNKTFQNKITEEVSIFYATFQSIKGRYFIGKSPTVTLGNGTNAWVGLINHPNSGVNLHVDVITINNFSSVDYILAGLWLNTNPPGIGTVSNNVTPANTSIVPTPTPKVQIQYVSSTTGTPTGGVNPFERIVPALNTAVIEDEGKIIIPPGGNLIVFLTTPSTTDITASVALGWWEERIIYCPPRPVC
ncbi:DUF6143 family protein [Gottschalkia purinilytica]|uniref:DUF6143 family protein n=1 Tax=Gottschalkia purinilytica TaxID=1503 RepID=UPI00067E5FF9|nr:DUF6143 family protein [Gottschalkia purinilytica]